MSDTALPFNKVNIRKDNEKEFSKYLSYILRHHPEDIGLSLMDGGWVKTEDLINAINNSTKNTYFVALFNLIDIVKNDNKQRYSFKSDSEDQHKYIRANQGHSIKGLIMDYKKVNPPKYLYHGTSENNAKGIIESGAIKPMSRQMVHLSKDVDTATNVGKRHGKPVIFRIDCEKAQSDGKKFYISDNGVYLTDVVETQYIEKIESEK